MGANAEKGFYKRGNTWYVLCYSVKGVRVRKSTGCSELVDAVAWRNSHMHQRIPRDALAMQNPFSGKKFTTTNKWVSDLHSRMKTRFPSDRILSRSDLEKLFDRADGRCEVTGIPFTSDPEYGGSRKPFIPSIDRIDSTKPYELYNCRLVCLAANLAMNEWGERVFDMLVMGRAYKKLQAI